MLASLTRHVPLEHNSCVLELVVLCLQYDVVGEAEADAAAPIEIDIVAVIAAGTSAALQPER